MGIWILMTFCALLIPVTMLIFGKLFRSSPPNDINLWYGYRTRRSMASEETWDFAHRYAGKVWGHLGLWTLALTVGAMLLLLGKSDDLVSWGGLAVTLLQLGPMLAVFPLTERALEKRFGGNGIS